MTGASQVLLVVKNLPASAEDVRDASSIPGWGRSPGGGRGKPLQSSCLENPMDRGGWRAAVHGVEKESDTTERLSTHACMRHEGILVLWPGTEFMPPAVELRSPHHWTTREFL